MFTLACQLGPLPIHGSLPKGPFGTPTSCQALCRLHIGLCGRLAATALPPERPGVCRQAAACSKARGAGRSAAPPTLLAATSSCSICSQASTTAPVTPAALAPASPARAAAIDFRASAAMLQRGGGGTKRGDRRRPGPLKMESLEH